MKVLLAVCVIMCAAGYCSASDLEGGAPKMSSRGILVAMTCFSTGEQTSGMNKICYYNCLGSAYAITIRAIDLCPLTIDR